MQGLLRRKARSSQRQGALVLLLTSHCNLRCIYCYAGGGERTAQEISPQMARAAVDIVYQNAVEGKKPRFDLIFHGGGEPVQALDVI